MAEDEDPAPESAYAPGEQILPGWPSGPEVDADVDGEESAFSLIGNETRAAIIRTLGEERGQEGPRPILSFSDLHDAVDVDVVSSQFNYHLQQLVGNFVDRTEDGYRLKPVGSTLYRTIRAGTFTGDASFGPVDVGFDCYHCGTRAEGVYGDGMFTVQCRGCETLYDLVLAPPEQLDPDDEAELVDRLNQYTRHQRLAFQRGVCPTCVNRLNTKLIDGEASPFADYEHRSVTVHQSCGHCGSQMYVSVGEALLYDPALISFCYERGLDVTSEPVWHLEFAMTDRCVSVRSRDPWAVALAVELDGDTLELVVDGEMNVLERNYS
ncbi:hypothetical protein HALDL1_06545 [Halobacterium sp. DL1]|jgi:hypothetical protein|nr:hypothetical protein HALDL1_06545 [Halobacterium sp. DL1]